MYKFLLTIFLFIFITQNSYSNSLDREAVKERLKDGYLCWGMFFESQFSKLLSNEIKTTNAYGMYHNKAMDIIMKPAHKAIKHLKKNKLKLTKKELKELEKSSEIGKKIIHDYLKSTSQNMVPIFIQGGNNKMGIIAKNNTEPTEMTNCKNKYSMDENDLLTFGITSTKVSKDKIKSITEKYLFGF